MEKYENEKGVWRTIRGRRIFIRSGESLGSAMARSGKFNDNGRLPRREDLMKGKKDLKLQEAYDKWHKEYDPKKYKTEDYQDPKKRALMDKRKEKVNKDLEKADKEKDDFMDLYDKDRDENELSWQDRVEKNNRETNKRTNELKEQRGKGQYMYHDDKWADDYYGTFRENEERNARIKQEPDDAPYEYVPAYKGFKEKADRLEGAKYDSQGNLQDYNKNATWTGKEYTNDEFMEHLTDANWHHERKMIEEAGLTNKQLRELKKDVKLDRYGVDLDPKKTQELIDKVKKEFPAKDTKKTIEDFKAKKQSNNKIDNDNKTITELNNEMLGDKYKGKGLTPSLIYSNDRRIEIANHIEGGKTATIWKDGKIERKTRLPENVKGDKTKQYFDDYLAKLDKDNLKQSNNKQETIKKYVEKKQSNNGKSLSYDNEQRQNIIKEIRKEEAAIKKLRYRGVTDGRSAFGKRDILKNERKYEKFIKEHQKKIEELEKKMK